MDSIRTHGSQSPTQQSKPTRTPRSRPHLHILAPLGTTQLRRLLKGPQHPPKPRHAWQRGLEEDVRGRSGRTWARAAAGRVMTRTERRARSGVRLT